MNLGEMHGEREMRLAVEVDDEDSLDVIESKWNQRFTEEGMAVTAEEVKDLARRTYEHFFDEHGKVRPENIEQGRV